MNNTLDAITELAHVHTFHPGAIDWSGAATPEELDYLSHVAFNESGHDAAAAAYIVKELAQLADIERHVASVMAMALSEMQASNNPVNAGASMHHALSCFAAEEMQHANTFYRYIRELSGWDLKLSDSVFAERFAVYQGPESPYVKLAALCCSAYVGESVITVFEHRTLSLDPNREHFLTELLYLHGLDEARHIQIDHFVFNEVVPQLSDTERAEMFALLERTEDLNRELAGRWQKVVTETAGFDYTVGNIAHHTQLSITQQIAARCFVDGTVLPVDQVLDEELTSAIASFSSRTSIHE